MTMKEVVIKNLKVRKLFFIPIIFILLSSYIIAALSSEVEVHYIYKVLPVFVIYVNDLNGDRIGIPKGPVVLICKNNRDSKIVLTHELIHAKQCYRYIFYYWIPMLFSDNMLTKMEAEAYASQITSEEQIPLWATFIKDEYKSSLTEKEIEYYIAYYWKKQQG